MDDKFAFCPSLLLCPPLLPAQIVSTFHSLPSFALSSWTESPFFFGHFPGNFRSGKRISANVISRKLRLNYGKEEEEEEGERGKKKIAWGERTSKKKREKGGSEK